MAFLFFIAIIAFIVYMFIRDTRIKKTDEFKKQIASGSKSSKFLWHRKWWVWVIILVLVFCAFGGMDSNDNDSDNTSSKPKTHKVEKKKSEEESSSKEEKEEKKQDKKGKIVSKEAMDQINEFKKGAKSDDQYDWSLFIDSIDYDGNSSANVQVRNEFSKLSVSEKNMVATHVNNEIAACADEHHALDGEVTDGVFLEFFTGNNMVGRSKVTDNNEYKWK